MSEENKNVLAKIDQANPDMPEFIFHCPGCGCGHWFKTTGKSPVWKFNGNLITPTVSPSIRVRGGNEKGMTTCHFFIKEGKIEYCSDSTHELKGKTVEMVVIQ